MPKIDITTHQRNASFSREIIDQLGMTYDQIAKQTGISRRRLQYIYKGALSDGRPTFPSYPEQFVLESLFEKNKTCAISQTDQNA